MSKHSTSSPPVRCIEMFVVGERTFAHYRQAEIDWYTVTDEVTGEDRRIRAAAFENAQQTFRRRRSGEAA